MSWICTWTLRIDVDEHLLQGYFPPPPPANARGFWRTIGSVVRKVSWFMLYCIAAVLLFGTISGWMADQFWICEIACHFQVQYIVGLASVAVVFAIGRRWRVAGIVIGAALLAFVVHWLPFYWSDAPVPIGKRSLRLLSGNVRFDNRSRASFFELIASEKPDIILLFEVSPIWVADLQSLASEFPHMRIAPNGGHWGCAILSRLPIDSVTVEPLGPSTNLILQANVSVGPNSVRLVGIHPRAPYTPPELALRNEQLTKIAGYLGPNTKRTIIAGDFNTSSWSSCFDRFAAATGTRDTRRGFGVCATFPAGYWPLITTIDHCLVSPDIGVLDRRVGTDFGSDHLPIVVDLAIEDVDESRD